MRNRLKDYEPKNIDLPCSCYECHMAQRYVVMAECDLEAASQEREGTKVVREAIARREQMAARKEQGAKDWNRDTYKALGFLCFMFSASCVMTAAGCLAWSSAWVFWKAIL